MELLPKNAESRDLYRILIGAVLPRPIAWVSTVDSANRVNLAPFSFFTVASVWPPVLCFCPLLKVDSGEKDTLANIKSTRDFVVNIVSENLAAQMNQTSGSYTSDLNEFEVAGLTQKASQVVKPTGVADSLVNFECKLDRIISYGDEALAGNLVLGEICYIHINDEVFQDGRINTDVLAPIGRLAGDMYTTVRDRFKMIRPD